MNTFLNKALEDYILSVSSKESPLLENLRRDTATHIGMANMLTGPIEGALLQMLVKISGAKKCLELGTFTGYSALHIAQALPVDGKLITCELKEQHAAFAQSYFDKSPHGHKIEIRQGEALSIIDSLHEEFDFIFIDADKGNYPSYYEKLIPTLRVGGLLVVDNALWAGEVVNPQDNQGRAIDKLNKMAHQDERVDTVMLSVRDGILLCRKR